MIRIGPASDAWAVQAAERLRPNINIGIAPGAPRFELPDLGADDPRDKHGADAPDAPDQLAPWLGGPVEHVEPPRARGDGGANARAERGAALERREGARREPGALQQREAQAKDSGPADDAALQQAASDDDAAAKLGDGLIGGRERGAKAAGADATPLPRRGEAGADAAKATSEARRQAGRIETAPANTARPVQAANPDAATAPARPERTEAQAATHEAKSAQAPAAPTTAQPAPAAAAPAVPASMALNAELARLLALTDGDDSLLPRLDAASAAASSEADLAALALSGASVRGGHVSPQRVAPALPAKDIAAQITDALANLAGDADGDQVIRLDGAEVGRFLAHVQVSGKDLLVQLSAHDPATRMLLAERAPEVRAELERAGVVAGGVDVRADGGGGSGAERRDGERDGEPLAPRGLTGAAAGGRRRGGSGAVASGLDEAGRLRERVDLIA